MAKPCLVYEDNAAARKIANNATAIKRTKHIDIRHHFIREHVENGLIDIKAVSSSEQRADFMTKVLGKVAFKRFCDIITSDVDLTDVDKRTCGLCSRVFDSRNKLHQHIREHPHNVT